MHFFNRNASPIIVTTILASPFAILITLEYLFPELVEPEFSLYLGVAQILIILLREIAARAALEAVVRGYENARGGSGEEWEGEEEWEEEEEEEGVVWEYSVGRGAWGEEEGEGDAVM